MDQQYESGAGENEEDAVERALNAYSPEVGLCDGDSHLAVVSADELQRC